MVYHCHQPLLLASQNWNVCVSQTPPMSRTKEILKLNLKKQHLIALIFWDLKPKPSLLQYSSFLHGSKKTPSCESWKREILLTTHEDLIRSVTRGVQFTFHLELNYFILTKNRDDIPFFPFLPSFKLQNHFKKKQQSTQITISYQVIKVKTLTQNWAFF